MMCERCGKNPQVKWKTDYASGHYRYCKECRSEIYSKNRRERKGLPTSESRGERKTPMPSSGVILSGKPRNPVEAKSSKGEQVSVSSVSVANRTSRTATLNPRNPESLPKQCEWCGFLVKDCTCPYGKKAHSESLTFPISDWKGKKATVSFEKKKVRAEDSEPPDRGDIDGDDGFREIKNREREGI